jgi:hypothetical protein
MDITPENTFGVSRAFLTAVVAQIIKENLLFLLKLKIRMPPSEKPTAAHHEQNEFDLHPHN